MYILEFGPFLPWALGQRTCCPTPRAGTGWLEVVAWWGRRRRERCRETREESTRFLRQSLRQLAQLNKLYSTKIMHELRVDTSRCRPAHSAHLFYFFYYGMSLTGRIRYGSSYLKTESYYLEKLKKLFVIFCTDRL